MRKHSYWQMWKYQWTEMSHKKEAEKKLKYEFTYRDTTNVEHKMCDYTSHVMLLRLLLNTVKVSSITPTYMTLLLFLSPLIAYL
jgi:hypothetical protein